MLGRRQETLLTREKALLGSMRDFLLDFDASPVDINVLQEAEDGLDELFLIAVVGEYNAGKSSFINALVGEDLCEEGTAPTTKLLTLLRHGEEPAERASGVGVVERRRPNDYLREVSILDTPPTIATEHQAQLQRHYVPAADLVLFVTSADRQLTESGRMFLQQTRRWGSKVVVVANKSDLLRKNRATVRAAVQERAREALDVVPPTFLVSSLIARRAAAASDPEERRHLLLESGFPALEAHMKGVLDEEERLRVKLEAALSPVAKLHIRYRFAIDERLGLLDGDLRTYETARSQLEFYRDEMKRDFASRLAEIGAVVSRMGVRGDAWFARNVRLSNALALARPERMRERFAAEVVAGTGETLDRRIGELADWMVDRNLAQWRSMVDYVEKRRQAVYSEATLRDLGENFRYDRDEVLLALGAEAGKIVGAYDRHEEAGEIARSLRGAARGTALAEAAALTMAGGAAASATVAAAAAIILAAGTLLVGGLGLVALPRRRRLIAEDFHRRNEALRRELAETIREQFLVELDRCAGGLDASIQRYGAFMRAEQRRLEEARVVLDAIYARAEDLRTEIALPGLREGGGR